MGRPPPVSRGLALAAAIIFASTVGADAQRLLLSVAFDAATTVTGFLDVHTGVVTPFSSETNSGGVFTADGQFLLRHVGSASPVLRLRHVPSGVETTLPFDFSPVVAHPRQMAMFGYSRGGLARLDASGLTIWSLSCALDPNRQFDMAADGSQLYVLCPAIGQFVVLDSTSGTLVREVTVGPPNSTYGFVASPDGAQIVVMRHQNLEWELARVDTTSGQTLKARPWGGFRFGNSLAAVPGREVLIVPRCAPILELPCDLSVVGFQSLDTLTHLSSATFYYQVFTTADAREAYVASREEDFYHVVVRFDLRSGTPLNTLRASFLHMAALASLPLPPGQLGAQVSNRAVTLTWQLPAHSPAATGYRLAIGTAAGATNLGSTALGPAETVTATGVPPGRYYVRLHSVNYTGESGPSAELVVAVP